MLEQWALFTKRTEDPKLAWLERALGAAGIPSRRNGNSFHAPILEVPEDKLDAAWEILHPVDDVPDDDPRWTAAAQDDEEVGGRASLFHEVWKDDDGVCLQESPAKKEVWLSVAQRVFPLGVDVLVVDTDAEGEFYIGKTGRVVGYSVGGNGEWPTVRVDFGAGVVDVFYEDELEVR